MTEATEEIVKRTEGDGATGAQFFHWTRIRRAQREWSQGSQIKLATSDAAAKEPPDELAQYTMRRVATYETTLMRTT